MTLFSIHAKSWLFLNFADGNMGIAHTKIVIPCLSLTYEESLSDYNTILIHCFHRTLSL